LVVVVTLGRLPGQIAVAHGHPQATAINVAGWVGMGSLGLLYPVALIWAFLKPSPAAAPGAGDGPARPGPAPAPDPSVGQMKARVELLEREVRNLQADRRGAP